MSNTSLLSSVQSTLLSRMNERQVLRVIQTHGPMSRAEVARSVGMSAPTASKAVESLLRVGYLEEGDAPEAGRGRPARRLRLPTETAQVLGLVLDATECRLVAAGLDGALRADRDIAFPTPSTYADLIATTASYADHFMARSGVTTLGLGISMPGLIDYRQQCGIFSPNLHLTDGRSPVRDLAQRLGIACVMLQESHALCLAERRHGSAQHRDNFAMLDVATGVGLGVMSGGRLLTGHSGLAGELGHITVVAANGRACGCGNHGCLETVASDTALVGAVSRRLGRKVSMDEVIALHQSGFLSPEDDLEQALDYLAIGVAAVINLFNPATLFLHGRMFYATPDAFARLIEKTRRRALAPTANECTIVQARGSKRQGAVAAIIEYLIESIVPGLDTGTNRRDGNAHASHLFL